MKKCTFVFLFLWLFLQALQCSAYPSASYAEGLEFDDSQDGGRMWWPSSLFLVSYDHLRKYWDSRLEPATIAPFNISPNRSTSFVGSKLHNLRNRIFSFVRYWRKNASTVTVQVLERSRCFS